MTCKQFLVESDTFLFVFSDVFFGLQGTLSRLSSLRLAVSHHYYYKKMDEYGKDFAINVVQRVKNESERLKHQHGASSTQGSTPSASLSVLVTPDKEGKIVFDNFDFKQHVHSMTEDHQNIDIHWVTHGSGKQRFREPLIQCETVT